MSESEINLDDDDDDDDDDITVFNNDAVWC